MNSFIDAAANYGQGFFWLTLILAFCYVFGWLIARIRHGLTSISLLEIVGALIMMSVFVFPAATIGAFLGKRVGAMLSLEYILGGLGLVIGAYCGWRLWRWTGTF